MMVEGGCPKCGSLAIFGSFKADDLYEKRGSKIVRKRNVKFVTFDWVCEDCGHRWSSYECVIGKRLVGSNEWKREIERALGENVNE